MGIPFVTEPVSVRTPATSANLGPGFDSLGLARVRLRVLADNGRALACYRRCGCREAGRVPVADEKAWNKVMKDGTEEVLAAVAEELEAVEQYEYVIVNDEIDDAVVGARRRSQRVRTGIRFVGDQVE